MKKMIENKKNSCMEKQNTNNPIEYLVSKLDSYTQFKLEKEIEIAFEMYHDKVENCLLLGIIYEDCGIKEVDTFEQLVEASEKIKLKSKDILYCDCDINTSTFLLDNSEERCCRCERKVNYED